FAQPAARSIGGDQVLSDERLRLTRGAVSKRGADLVGVLLEPLQFGVEANVRAAAFGVAPQDRFEHVLVAGRRLGGTDRARVGPGRPAPVNLGIAQGPGSRNPPALLIARPLRADLRLQPE